MFCRPLGVHDCDLRFVPAISARKARPLAAAQLIEPAANAQDVHHAVTKTAACAARQIRQTAVAVAASTARVAAT